MKTNQEIADFERYLLSHGWASVEAWMQRPEEEVWEKKGDPRREHYSDGTPFRSEVAWQIRLTGGRWWSVRVWVPPVLSFGAYFETAKTGEGLEALQTSLESLGA